MMARRVWWGAAARGARPLCTATTAESFLGSLAQTNYETAADRSALKASTSTASASDSDSLLGPVRNLLRVLGDPQHAFPVIHVVGSKGKGTTAALLTQILAPVRAILSSSSSQHL